MIDTVGKLNRHRDAAIHDPEIATRIAQYELAFKMQMSVPKLMDFSDETKETLDPLRHQRGATGRSRATACSPGGWPSGGCGSFSFITAGGITMAASRRASRKRPSTSIKGRAALIQDLKRRGMLDETLLVWGGEFGRTPMAQGDGRDHHMKGFSIFMAGGGIKPGVTYGATDELGYNAAENVVSVHDLHATMLHLLGIDHQRLTYR